LLNVNPPQDAGAGMTGVAHELGHYCGYACGDTVMKGGKVDPGHSSDIANIMYRAAGTGSNPDECYCRNLDQKVK